MTLIESERPAGDAERSDAIAAWGSIIKSVGLTNRRLHAGLRREFDLGEAEVDTLVTLGADGSHRATMTALATSAAFTSGGYTKIADRLEQRGLLQRVQDTTDRRVTLLELTEQGIAMSGRVRAHIAAFLATEVVGPLGMPTVHEVAEALGALHSA